MSSTIEQVILTAPDSSGNHGVMTVEEALGALPGIASLAAGETIARIRAAYDPNRVSLTQIEAALDEAEYPVQKQPSPLAG